MQEIKAECNLKNGRILKNFNQPYYVAEMNSSHNGSIECAKKMIDEAVRIGCDAVKFQSWSAESLYSKNYYDENVIAKRMVERFALKPEELKELANYCVKKGIDFSSTPYSIEEVNFLVDECGAAFVKIASMDINNERLLRFTARKGVAIILSTGMAEIEEIVNAVNIIKEEGNDNICVLHCVSEYPVSDMDVNLNNMVEISRELGGCVYGYSDHTTGDLASIAAIAQGAALIEKHFTLDNKKIGWDNQMATEPDEFKKMIDRCNLTHQILGRRIRIISQEEQQQKLKMRRSVVASRHLMKGEEIKEGDMDAKRPGTGIPLIQMKNLIGKRVTREIQQNEMIFWEDLD